MVDRSAPRAFSNTDFFRKVEAPKIAVFGFHTYLHCTINMNLVERKVLC